MTRFACLPLLLALGCAAYDGALVGRESDDDDWTGDDDAPADDDDGAPDAGDGEPADETENDFLGSEPRGTDQFVFIANPSRDTVTRIRASDRSITTIDVGRRPTQVVVSPDYSQAVAYNAGSDSVSIIQTLTADVQELPVREDLNRIDGSPDGRWVLAWFDAAAVDAEFGVEGVRSYDEVSFVDTWEGRVESYAVGFNPRGVRFTADASTAVLYAEGLLAVADLTAEPVRIELLDLGMDPVDPPRAAEVEVTPSGSWAFVRFSDVDEVRAVDLGTGAVASLSVGLGPSDIDLSPDGQELVVVARESHELRVFDAQDPFAGPDRVLATPADSTIGSLVLAPDDRRGLLFTTAALEDRMTVWDRATDTLVERALVKPVQGVAIAPDGRSALVLHTLADAPDEHDLFTDRWALTVVDLESGITNAVALEAQPTRWSTSDDGRYTLFLMAGSRQVGVIDYQSRLVDDLSVPSLPVFVGMMPERETPQDALGWVSQEHELGRISFVAPYDGTVETVTGFELNGGIER